MPQTVKKIAENRNASATTHLCLFATAFIAGAAICSISRQKYVRTITQSHIASPRNNAVPIDALLDAMEKRRVTTVVTREGTFICQVARIEGDGLIVKVLDDLPSNTASAQSSSTGSYPMSIGWKRIQQIILCDASGENMCDVDLNPSEIIGFSEIGSLDSFTIFDGKRLVHYIGVGPAIGRQFQGEQVTIRFTATDYDNANLSVYREAEYQRRETEKCPDDWNNRGIRRPACVVGDRPMEERDLDAEDEYRANGLI